MPKKKTASIKKKSATKKAVKKTTTKAAKKTAAKKTAKKVKKVAKKSAAKKVAQSSASTSTVAVSSQVASKPAKDTTEESKSAPIVFSLDDVEQLMATKKKEAQSTEESTQKPAAKSPAKKATKIVVDDQPTKQRVLGAASLADILGFDPKTKAKSTDLSNEEVPKKWKKYYNLLIELRAHVSDEIDLHTAETLKHSSRDDSGDLSSYGTHQAEAGTDTFDRDFALSLVSSEQDALNEIEEAILRIRKGTYGVCEVTGKAIPAARLTAVPFARYSVEGQAEYEKNVRRKVDRGSNTGLFGDASDTPKLASSDDDD